MENKLAGNFEPSYEWQHEEGFDLLLVHLPEFKDKEGLKVQVSNCGVLKISGDRQENQTRLRFLKEIQVRKNHDKDEIKAKFEKGVLKITLPNKVDEEYELTTTSNKSRFKKFKKEATGVAAIVVVVAALSGFAYYIYRTTIIKD